MSIITTMEDLTSLNPGTTVTIGREEWAVADGRRLAMPNSDVSVPMHTLTGQIAAGQVTLGARYEVGQWWHSHGTHYYITEVDSTQSADVSICAYTRDGSYLSSDRYASSQVDFGTLVSQQEPWMGSAATTANAMTRYRQQWARDLAEADQRVASLRTEIEAARQSTIAAQETLENLKGALSEWATDNYDSLDSDLRDLLDEYDVRLTESISVDVAIDGVSEVDFETILGQDGVEEAIQHDRLADWPSNSDTIVRLNWTASTSITVEAARGECGCAEVDRDMVAQWLNENNFNYDSFSYSLDCENC